jgi:hypothetical protein
MQDRDFPSISRAALEERGQEIAVRAVIGFNNREKNEFHAAF